MVGSSYDAEQCNGLCKPAHFEADYTIDLGPVLADNTSATTVACKGWSPDSDNRASFLCIGGSDASRSIDRKGWI